ncbi:hypothetical protein MJN54_32610, partial [Salmonella enterica subsp. enterica serovar Kentucky]|nr:hypothetical protein [Salmonella enterica subsp. enterica serovar Kentucky]
RIPPELLRQHLEYVKTGLPGMAWVRLDERVPWPDDLNVRLSHENKPLLSLWAQWYIGLMTPPLMLALLTQARAINVSAEHIHVE